MEHKDKVEGDATTIQKLATFVAKVFY